MAWKVGELFDRVWDCLIPDGDAVKAEDEGKDELLKDVEKARAEWLAAKTYFDNVTDPDLVDHAIYSIEASERKYMFLLKRASALGYGIAPSPGAPSGGDAAELSAVRSPSAP